MTKKEFVRKIARDNGFYIYQVNEYLDAITKGITEVIQGGDKVKLIGFGTFNPMRAKGYKSMFQGQEVTHRPYNKIRFDTSPDLKRLLTEDYEAKEEEKMVSCTLSPEDEEEN